MKKHIQIIAGILLLIASNTLSAQDKASELIQQVAQSIGSHKNIEVSFTYQNVYGTNQSEAEKEGIGYFQGEAYKVVMDGTENISNGTTKWAYLIDEDEVMVSNATDGDNPVKLLTELEKGSTVKTKGTDANGNQLIEYFDKDGDSMGLVLKFSKKGDFKGLEMDFGEGESLILNVTGIKYDQDYPESFFTFDEKAHPNVEVIDMR